MTIVRKNEGQLYTPAGHDSEVASNKIFNPANKCQKADVHITTFFPGAGMEQETHELSDHIFYILSGELAVLKDGAVAGNLKEGDAIHIAAGEAHQLKNNGEDPGIFLAITVPPLKETKKNIYINQEE